MTAARMVAFGEYVDDGTASAMKQRDYKDSTDLVVTHTLRGEGFDASEDGTGRGTPVVPVAFSIMPMNSGKDYKARETDIAQPLMAGGPVGGNQGGDFVVAFPANLSGTPSVPITFGAQMSVPQTDFDMVQTLQAKNPMAVAFSCKDHGADAGDIAPTLRSMGHDGSHANGGGQVAVAIGFNGDQSEKTRSMGEKEEQAPTLRAEAPTHVAASMQVRRLTPTECERLQGFPDGYTLITVRGKPAADGPRYKALGNSMAVPVMHWIGKQIDNAANLI